MVSLKAVSLYHRKNEIKQKDMATPRSFVQALGSGYKFKRVYDAGSKNMAKYNTSNQSRCNT